MVGGIVNRAAVETGYGSVIGFEHALVVERYRPHAFFRVHLAISLE
jgi:hypothetical protein